MDPRKLVGELKKGTPTATYLVAGEEDALVDRALSELTAQVLAGSKAPDLACSRFDGRGAAADEIEGAARTVSLFGGRRLVVVRDAQDLRPVEHKRLCEYLEHPVKGNILVLVVRGAGPDSRDPRRAKAAKAAKALKKAVEAGGGTVVDCPKPKARDLPALAEQLLREHQLKAGTEALHALVDAVGEDLGALVQAVEKLSLYQGGPGEIQRQDVAEVVIDTREESVFALTDAVSEGAPAKALGILRRLVREGEHPLALLGQLVRHFRNLARVSALRKRNQSPDQMRSQLGLHPFVVRKCLDQGARFTEAALALRLKRLAEADQRLKRNRLPEDLELEALVLSLCQKNR